MAFSIKNIFQKGGGAESKQAATPAGGGFFGGNGAVVSSSPFGTVPPNNDAAQMPAGGFGQGMPQATGFGGTLFRTVGSENLDGAPVTPGNGGSPFAPFASPERTTLTAGDFLPHLPPDVIRANGVMPDQPVAVSPQALETAISSGQLAVPLFEIYHVCPGLFRVPVSPHDTRMIPLPKSKLPSMIASHTSALKPSVGPAQVPAGASPFGTSMPAAQAPNPFAPALPELPPSGPLGGTRPAGTLPPRRPPGTAPAIPTQADFIGQNSLSLPGHPMPEAQGHAPRSLFQPMGGESPMGPGPSASPFGAMPSQPSSIQQPSAGATSLLFGLGKPPSDPELGGAGGYNSPMSQPNGTGEGVSPFGAMQMPAPGGSPFGTGPQDSPFQTEAGGGPDASSLAAGFPASFGAVPSSGPQGASPFQLGSMESLGASHFTAPSAQPAASPFPSPLPGSSAESPFHAATSAAPLPLVQPLPFNPFGPLPEPSASPFAVQGPSSQESGPPASPFASHPPQVASFEVQLRPVTPEPPKLGNVPFAAQQTGRTIKILPGQNPYGPPSAPPAMGGGPEEIMEVSLAAVLKGQAAQDLGFDPNFIPGWITTKLPAAEVRDQLGSGQVALSLGMIIDGTDNSFRSVISHGRREFTVRLAASDVFHTMAPASSTPSLTPPVPEPQAGQMQPQSPFQPPVMFGGAPPPIQPLAIPALPTLGASEGFIQPSQRELPVRPAAFPSFQPSPLPSFPAAPSAVPEPTATFDPFAAAAGDWAGKAGSPLFAPAPEITKPEGLSSDQLFADSAQASLPVAANPVFIPAPEKVPLAASFFADIPPARSEPVLAPEVSRSPLVPLKKEADQVFSPAAAAVPAMRPVGAVIPPMTGLSLSAAGDNDQLMIRALLGVSEKLDRKAVLEHVARLPGVAACAWVRGERVVAEGEGSKAAQDFRQQAPDIATSMRTLARLTGLEAETLSIAVGDRLLTFCLQQDQSLGVLHTSMEPPSGLREKITLLSRELAQMSDDR